jgi:DHA1 family multidrug/chloramphenicol efflux transport protein-like MFS transporter
MMHKLHNKNILFPILLVLYEIATYLSNDMYLPALPDMMKELDLSTKQAQWTLTSWFMGAASLPLLMGVISDRFGRRPILLWGGMLYIIATVICALAHDPYTLLIVRFIEGAAIPSMMVAGYACIHELYEQKEAVKILALMGSITVLAPAVGPLLGSFILYFASWRGIFWFIAIWSTISILLLAKWMPETHPIEKRQPIHWGSLLKQYFNVITNKRFMLLMFVQGFIFAGFIAWISAGPLLVIETFDYSPLIFGVIQLLIFSAYIASNHCVKHLVEAIGISRLIQLGLGIALAGGFFIFLFAYYLPSHLFLFLIPMTLYSIGSALCFAPLNLSIIDSSDEPMGTRMALFTAMWQGFAGLGSLVASVFFNGTIASIAYPMAAAALISCVMWFFVSSS